MKAYGIFAGGGVKGVALAGALAAANRKQIKFLGYGGASAGAIIAYLAAIGLKGDEIYLKMIRQPFKEMIFEDQGKRFFSLKKSFTDISKLPISIKKACKSCNIDDFIHNIKYTSQTCVPFIKSITPIIGVINSKDLGIYDTNQLRKTLFEWTKTKQPSLFSTGTDKITFEDLYNITGIDLKIICSDISSKRAIVYSACDTPNHDVLSAVCSSASYPFLFNPNINDNQVLIDGGLSSNLPMFMFKNEHKHRNVPIYAFDLHKEALLPEGPLGRIGYLSRLVDTALEASDNVMFEMLNAKKVRVNVPKDIDTLDINITKLDIMRLYYAGLIDGLDFFSNDRTVQLLKASVDDITKAALANYGSAEMFRVILNAIQEESTFNNEFVRVWLYVPTARSSIVSLSTSKNAIGKIYEWKVDEKNEEIIDAREAWEKKAEVISYLNDENNHYRTRISFPIFREEDTLQFYKTRTSESNCVGVLVLDVNLAPPQCMWLYFTKQNRIILNEIFRKEMLEPWLVVLGRMLSNTHF